MSTTIFHENVLCYPESILILYVHLVATLIFWMFGYKLLIEHQHTKIIVMNSCFVSNLQIDSIFVTFDFTAIQRGVKFLLPVTVWVFE